MSYIYILAMIVSVQGGQPLPVTIRVHKSEAACVAERGQLEAKENERKQAGAKLREIDYVCQEKPA